MSNAVQNTMPDAHANQTVCLAAVQYRGWVIEHMSAEQRTPQVCLAAVQQSGQTVFYLREHERTPEVCLAAVQQDGHAVEHLWPEQRTPEVCLAAVQQDGRAIQHLNSRERIHEVCLQAVRQNGHAIHFLAEQERSEQVCAAAIEQAPLAVSHLSPQLLDGHLLDAVLSGAQDSSGSAGASHAANAPIKPGSGANHSPAATAQETLQEVLQEVPLVLSLDELCAHVDSQISLMLSAPRILDVQDVECAVQAFRAGNFKGPVRHDDEYEHVDDVEIGGGAAQGLSSASVLPRCGHD